MLHIDYDALAWFNTAGRGCQARINAVLRALYEPQELSDSHVRLEDEAYGHGR